MKVIFLHHSSFLVELERYVFIFDYFGGDRVNGFHFTGVLPQLDADKQILVFASHKHQDHFDMDNLRLADEYPDVRFVFSKDCKMTHNFLEKHGFDRTVADRITYVAPDRTYEVGGAEIRTLASTDAGVAFCVRAEDRLIYHAGDLNWWYWDGVGEIINGRMEKGFKRAMRQIENLHFNLAFVPLDPRLGSDAFKGFHYFMRHIDADHVFPMHMWQDYSLIAKYQSRTDNDYFLSRIVKIDRENQVFDFKK